MASPISSRPADKRTTDFGINIRATAMVRTNSLSLGGVTFSNGVPAIGTSRLMGTESGWVARFANDCNIEARSVGVSPKPKIPPLQTWILAFFTLCSFRFKIHRSAKADTSKRVKFLSDLLQWLSMCLRKHLRETFEKVHGQLYDDFASAGASKQKTR